MKKEIAPESSSVGRRRSDAAVMSWGQPARPAVTNPNNDFLVANPPNDGVSSLKWSPAGNFLRRR